jgi:hypothetical protein
MPLAYHIYTSTMKTTAGLNSSIMAITMQMEADFPELLQYMGEMTITIPDQTSPNIDRAALHDYYQSLVLLLNKYADSHPGKGHTG